MLKCKWWRAEGNEQLCGGRLQREALMASALRRCHKQWGETLSPKHTAAAAFRGDNVSWDKLGAGAVSCCRVPSSVPRHVWAILRRVGAGGVWLCRASGIFVGEGEFLDNKTELEEVMEKHDDPCPMAVPHAQFYIMNGSLSAKTATQNQPTQLKCHS